MAFLKINKAIIEVVNKVEITTVNNLTEFLKVKLSEDYDDEYVTRVTSLIKQFSDTIMKTDSVINELSVKKTKKSDTEKRTREPTAYNLFLKAKMAEIKEAGTDLKGKELMMAAIVEWNKEKKANSQEEESEKPEKSKKSAKKPSGKVATRTDRILAAAVNSSETEDEE